MPQYSFVSKERIDKGWSGDVKYCARDAQGNRYLLRVSPIEQRDRKEREYRYMAQVSALGVPMCRPLEFGVSDEGVYSVQTWVDGTDAETALPALTDAEQYFYGTEAGKILKKIHSIPAPDGLECWEDFFNRKMDRKIQRYEECPVKIENGQAFIDYIHAHRHLLHGRKRTYQHGDYHVGNMMFGADKRLYIIDFDKNDFGDPWEEFNRIVWCAGVSPLFASGMVNGYFENRVPMEFWELLVLYISSNTLSAVPWAVPFGEKEVQVMMDQARDVLRWYDNMKNPVPSWYSAGYYLQMVNGIPFKLKSAFDFDFLSVYGTVFKVFDDQDSGNICFGLEKDGRRFFMKFAGAPTEQYDGDPAQAVLRLKAALPVYHTLHHENLIELLDAAETGGGFAALFSWADGECTGRMFPAAHRRFLRLPAENRLSVFRDILGFLEYTAAQKYVALDFYDGSVLYDAAAGKTTFCDIDFFRRQPVVNDMGRMWGSSLFQAPEEFQLGAVLDEITNVYTAGAFAFALFGAYHRTRDTWQLSDALFDIASQAVREERSERQQSIRQLREEWETALARGLEA